MSDLLGIIVGTLGGAAVGLERERSGHAVGREARFAGLRTLTLLGGLAGLSGWMWIHALGPLALVVAGGCAALIVAAYVSASRRHVDGTTEVAAFVVLAAGLLAGVGHLALASAVVALTALILAEKSRLHSMVARIDDEGLRAGFRFAVMAIVVLPLLPEGPYGPYGGVRPRDLWILVLFFSGLSFVGYIARRLIGETHGDVIAGLLGGIVSSTSVTLTYARASRAEQASPRSLGVGVIAACTVLFPRVLIAVAVLYPPLVWALMPYLLPPFVAGTAAALGGFAVARRSTSETPPSGPGNPLALGAAIQMTALFQLVLLAVHVIRAYWGNAGVIVSGAVLGLTDLDALTISMARQASTGLTLTTSARALAVGTISNAVLKLVIALAIGQGAFRVSAGLGIALIGLVGLAALMWS